MSNSIIVTRVAFAYVNAFSKDITDTTNNQSKA